LIRALQELENAASGDSVLRQRISSLPAEVQDTSLLHRITGKREDTIRTKKAAGTFALTLNYSCFLFVPAAVLCSLSFGPVPSVHHLDQKSFRPKLMGKVGPTFENAEFRLLT